MSPPQFDEDHYLAALHHANIFRQMDDAERACVVRLGYGVLLLAVTTFPHQRCGHQG